MPNWDRVRREIRRLRESLKARTAAESPEPWDWYGGSCPCGTAIGECRAHPRARPDQRPPAGDWRAWVMLMGRGSGKTRAAAEWVRHRVETGRAGRVALLGATAADVRDVMVEGPSGILAVSPPWNRPRYEPSKRRLTWPNGAVALTFSADEPNRLRGPQHDGAWIDEVATFAGPAALDQLLFGLRLGQDPRLCITTTPRALKWLTELLSDPTTAVSRGTTYDNRAHLAASFFDRIVTRFEGTRLGRQELLGEVLEVSDGVWFTAFDPDRHQTERAEYDPSLPVYLAIDCGVSRHTAAVWYQLRPGRGFPVRAPSGWVMTPPETGHTTVTVFADWYSEGLYSAAAAEAIAAHAAELPHRGEHDLVYLDPASNARTGIGPAASEEFRAVFGRVEHWPRHRVHDGLDQLEVLLDSGCLLLHPRCEHTKCAMLNYSRKKTTSGDWLDDPADPQHPHEDLMDALRGGIRARLPGGRIEQPDIRTVRAGEV